MDDPPPPPPPNDDIDPPPPPGDDDDLPPPPAPQDDDGDVVPPPPTGSPLLSPSVKPKTPITTLPSQKGPAKVDVDRTEPVHAESDFRILIREMKRLVGAADDDNSANPPEPFKKCTWENIYNDSYLDSYFGERLGSVLMAARKQKVVLFAPERLVRAVKKDAEISLISYQVPDGLKGAGAYQKAVAKAEERAAANAKKAEEMKKRLKDMKTTVGELIEEIEEVEEVEEVSDKDENDDDVAPPPPPPDDDDDNGPPPPPPADSDDDGGPPPPPPADDDDDPPPPPPDD